MALHGTGPFRSRARAAKPAAYQAQGGELRAAFRARRVPRHLRCRGSAGAGSTAQSGRRVSAVFRERRPVFRRDWLSTMPKTAGCRNLLHLITVCGSARLLPGLERFGVPMPLGGTSNHFRTQVLRAIGGWDPFNVTEDADIGIRLAQLGYRTAMLDSTTFEEAPTQVGVWIKQRSRWLKGYMQTWLVHGRNATRALRAGQAWRGFFAFQILHRRRRSFGSRQSHPVGDLRDILFMPLPIFGDGSAIISGQTRRRWAPSVRTVRAPHPRVSGSARRGDGKLAPYGLTVAVYWLLISVAGYRGLWHLIIKPFHWEKTAHGLSGEGSEHV